MIRTLLVSIIVASSALHAMTATAQPVSTPATALRSAHVTGSGTIQGTALSSTNATLSDAAIRLRDARGGRIVAATTSDRAGLFAFRSVPPGSYVVELLGRDQTTLAASQILNVNNGDTVSAIVKLPFRVSAFERILGHSLPSAAIVTSTAAAAGVLATQVSGEPVSPRR